MHSQGELEHRGPKSAYTRTSKKNYVKQITQIERCQNRIHRLQTHLLAANKIQNVVPEDIEAATSPSARYHVGATQNRPENIPLFLQRNSADPSIKVSGASSYVTKLRIKLFRTLYLISKLTFSSELYLFCIYHLTH